MQQSRSEANPFSASQEFHRILWDPMVLNAVTIARHLSLS
jgi:hypothetical protein